MSGEEAAASLFGSEDSGSDLFATLGADTTSPSLSQGNLFPNETSAHGPQANTYNFLSDTQDSREYATEFPSYPPETQAHVDYDAASFVPHNSTKNNQWDEYEKDNAASAYTGVLNTQANDPQAINVAYPNYVPAAHSAESSSYSTYGAYNLPVQRQISAIQHLSYATSNPPAPVHSYTPHSVYEPPLAAHASYTSHGPPTTTTQSHASYEPAATQAKSTYGAYDPPAPAKHTSYSAYDPPVPKVPLTHSHTGTYNPPTPAYDTPYPKPEQSFAVDADIYSITKSNPQLNTHPGPNPPSVAAKSVLTRPKVSNAYDPPFPAALPTRRTSRTATLSVQQAYAQYQTPTETYHGHNKEPPPSQSANRPIHPNSSPVETSPWRLGRNEKYEKHREDQFPIDPESDSSYFPHYEDASSANSYIKDDVVVDTGAQSLSSNHVPEDTTYLTQTSNELTPAVVSSYASDNDQQAPASWMQPKPASPLTPLPYSPLPENSQEYAGAHLPQNESDNKVLPPSSSPPKYGAKKEFPPIRDIHDPYAPKTAHITNNYIPRTSSPLSLHNGRQNEPKKPAGNLGDHPNIMSITSSPPISKLVGSGNLYTPLIIPHDHQAIPPNSQWPETKLGFQELTVKTTTGQYAPSPSLIGANDPLSRTSARAPVITFGFGGKMVTCFHGMPGLNAGFDVAFSSRTTSELKIRVLHKTLPESALNAVESSYPGPLLADPGATSMSLVRPNVATQMKAKKTSILNYLTGRVSEIHQGLGYLSGAERKTAEDKLILVKLLSVMVENDGRLWGSTQSELAVRSTLVPRIEGTPIIQDAVTIQASFRNSALDEAPISVSTLRSSALDKIEEFLLRGDRRQAYQYAAEEKLWAHAMVISSSIDKESWKEVVHDFLRTELPVKEELDSTSHLSNGHMSNPKNRESLRVAYSLFSGQGPAAVQEMAPLSLLQRGLGRFQSPMIPAVTPRTPNFAPIQPANMGPTIPPASLGKWAETAAMILCSPLTAEASAALTALGDQLLANNWVEAGHVCYLLSPQTSLIGGLGSQAAKITLVGSKNPANVMKDPDALIFSEILEYALSLVTIAKGQEPFHGIPHLQAYRFIKTITLAEVGEVQLANRYCEAITTCLSQTSPYTNLALVDQLQGLQQRLSGIYPGDKSGSWIGGKIGKPSLDSIGGWLEGRFTKLVTGESEDGASTGNQAKAIDQPFAGPFAHYSNISSTTPSARSSPQPQAPSATFSMPPPPQRTSSAMATATSYSQQIQVERSSSAMDHVRQRPTVHTYTQSSNPLSSSQSSPTTNLNTQPHISDPYAPKGQDSASPNDELETPVQTSWWGAHAENGSNTTPTAATFMRVEESSIQASDDGFISLMDSHTFSVGPSKQTSKAASPARTLDDQDDDDLGLGNSRPKPKPEQEENGAVKAQSASPSTNAAPAPVNGATTTAAAAAPASGGSWLGRWFKRSESTGPGPIKASLGEESAFYYDKEQKRWVNRKAGSAEAEKPATPPPPPSRAQTASPGMTGSKPSPPPGGGPPVRSVSAIDLSEPPVKAPMRIRSNLAPPMESAPSTPTGTRVNPVGGPPPPRPKSQATKRNVRSRYVDVLQQEGGGA
ncbi:hypothetical protein HYPSUDRAFT_75121 [Hypholoma sublateritium FD-334 SS-4]|uniref:Protein transport protein sec16 n=1 Tax=Hypholoma sublateritium (strain FD-334 SS-4) TaxID=945553 RepID=A0A0D2PFB4_HYPSF|nr:hypothetical protein HYPSUDRAFT_75121 [Hypholoma sublateritium FD-334 SS-4]